MISAGTKFILFLSKHLELRVLIIIHFTNKMAGRINPVEVARKKLVDNGQSHVLDLLAPEQFSAENPIVKQVRIHLSVV